MQSENNSNKKPFNKRKGQASGNRKFDSRGKAPFGKRNSRPRNGKPINTGRKPFAKGKTKEAPEKKQNSLARLTAFRIIQDITVRGAYTSLAINNVLKVNKLPDNDKRLVTNIVYTTIENIIKIDYCIDSFMEHPSYEPALRDVLRIGVAQILFMDKIPDFAIINESVNLMRLVSSVEAWQGVVNGVLRNIVRNKDNIA